MKILVTCPPMIKQISNYKVLLDELNFKVYCPNFVQTLSEEELVEMLPEYDGWIIGDDPATRRVFEAGMAGRLKAVVKWGVGIDNVDVEACKELKLPMTHTPGMFGEEVSDVAVGYVINLSRRLHVIDRLNRQGGWYKPCGVSLKGKKVCLVGFGDIGRCTARKLLSFGMDIHVSDPGFTQADGELICTYSDMIELPKILNKVKLNSLVICAKDADYMIITCVLNKYTRGMINKNILSLAKRGMRLINVSRGPIVSESDVLELLDSGHIDSVGFDVFENEPLTLSNPLHKNPNNIFGSHNGSNTIEAVYKTSFMALAKLNDFLRRSSESQKAHMEKIISSIPSPEKTL